MRSANQQFKKLRPGVEYRLEEAHGEFSIIPPLVVVSSKLARLAMQDGSNLECNIRKERNGGFAIVRTDEPLVSSQRTQAGFTIESPSQNWDLAVRAARRSREVVLEYQGTTLGRVKLRHERIAGDWYQTGWRRHIDERQVTYQFKGSIQVQGPVPLPIVAICLRHAIGGRRSRKKRTGRWAETIVPGGEGGPTSTESRW